MTLRPAETYAVESLATFRDRFEVLDEELDGVEEDMLYDTVRAVLSARSREYVVELDDGVVRITELAPTSEGIPDVVRKFRLKNVEMTVTTVAEPDDADSAISDAVPGALIHGYDVAESFTVEPYGGERHVGEDHD